MTQRSQFLVQMLEKIGAPLLTAVTDLAAHYPGRPPAEAERMAELLARSVQMGLGLAEKMDLKGAGGSPDAVRLALAGVAATLVSSHYRQIGQAPGEAEIKRLVTALEAVLSFADNFAPAPENIARLQAIDAGLFPADENQVSVQYIHAMVPVVNALAQYSFGRPERKLAQDVAVRLIARASSVCRNLLGPDAPSAQARPAELALLRAFGLLYAECHEAEQKRLASLSPDERARIPQEDGGLSMETLWQGFDLRVDMLEVLAQNAVPVSGARKGGSRTPVPAAAVTAGNVPSPLAPPQTPPVADPAQDNAGGNYNPMSFFKKKEGEGGQ